MKTSFCMLAAVMVFVNIFTGCSKKNPTEADSKIMTDIDGNTYQTVQIGNQVWMAENLKVTHYRDGTSIHHVTGLAQWTFLSAGAYCAYDTSESTADTYGYLYNWFAVSDSRNIAPEGWRVPTDDDWKELEMFLGLSTTEADLDAIRGSDEGSKLAGNASLWESGDLENNAVFGESGFLALPGGYRMGSSGHFGGLGTYAEFWSFTEYSSSRAWYRSLDHACSGVFRYRYDKRGGLSVRLISE